MNASRLYREINVLRQINDRVVIRYRCFHILPDDKYCVKAADFIREPQQEGDLKSQERYYLESLFYGGLEMLLPDACDSIEEAIAKHDKQFETNG